MEHVGLEKGRRECDCGPPADLIICLESFNTQPQTSTHQARILKHLQVCLHTILDVVLASEKKPEEGQEFQDRGLVHIFVEDLLQLVIELQAKNCRI